MSQVKVLVIDDDPLMLELARYRLQSHGYAVSSAGTGEEGMRRVAESRFEIVLADWQLPDIGGLDLVKLIREASPDSEVLVITGHGSVARAIEVIKAGAFYFVEKPVEFDELLALMEKALERRQQREEIHQLRGRLTERASYFNIIGGSKPMQDIYEIIESVADSDANILIVGESGTGKELIANAVHYKSARGNKPFVKINCSALPQELIESELFGHVKGAFTGATADKVGLIGRADGGSLMLDEIAEMPVGLQPKLLRVLQERIYYRLGSEKAQATDFRLISATNRRPLDAVRGASLREDLYYRINTIEIHVPPLRERSEDIQRLAEHFLAEFAAKYDRPVRAISQAAYAALFAYHWPGNVRELRNVIERAVLLAKDHTIDGLALPAEMAEPRAMAAAATAGVPAPAPAFGDSGGNPWPLSFDQIGRAVIGQLATPDPSADPPDVFKQLESAIVEAALDRTKGNKQAAAHLLGVYRPRLYSIIKRTQRQAR
ncbi:MAG TPA: sigma-54 dependent transcriptional regulator [Blastocatellia bacterium]|nr:sigma-54 dependent transcriptional regulator [Blastocatellia bacterium]